jgi:hypothetical protein
MGRRLGCRIWNCTFLDNFVVALIASGFPAQAVAARTARRREANLQRSVLIAGAILIGVGAIVAASWLFFGGHDRARGRTTDRADAAYHEWRLASADHKNVAESVAACSGIGTLAGQPAYIRDELRLDVLPDGKHFQPASANDPKAGEPRDAASTPKALAEFSMSNYARTAIYLSDSIVRARIESANNAASSHSTMLWFQWSIVIIGALTTILISLKSIVTSDDALKRLSFHIGIAAILLSSIGTATAGLNSFFGPRESYLKAERSLASLRQLHSDIAVQIAAIREPPGKQDRRECPSFDPAAKDDPLAKQVQDWKTKLNAIANSSDSGSSSPSETAVPDASSGTGDGT